jgi:hypothetical protein
MEEYIYLISGSIILLLTIFDFFFTTLSGSGASFFTRFISMISHQLIQLGVKLAGRKVYSLSGMIVNLMVLASWVILVWLGLFLLFSSDPGAITNSNNRMASSIERLYFTGYVLSTLGIGNFKPTTPFFELLTSLFSFFGFVFFTTSMTYLISVSSAVINKRTMALSIHSLGDTPKELVKNLMEKDSSFAYQKISTLQEMIQRHYVNHQAYPVLHYYSTSDVASSISISLAILDEALNIMLYAPKQNKYFNELTPLRSSLTKLLQKIQQKYTRSTDDNKHSFRNVTFLNKIDETLFIEKIPLSQRREVLGKMLSSEGYNWKDVFEGYDEA